MQDGRHGMGGCLTERLRQTLHATPCANLQPAHQLRSPVMRTPECVELFVHERTMQHVERVDQPPIVAEIGVDISHNACHALATQTLKLGTQRNIP